MFMYCTSSFLVLRTRVEHNQPLVHRPKYPLLCSDFSSCAMKKTLPIPTSPLQHLRHQISRHGVHVGLDHKSLVDDACTSPVLAIRLRGLLPSSTFLLESFCESFPHSRSGLRPGSVGGAPRSPTCGTAPLIRACSMRLQTLVTSSQFDRPTMHSSSRRGTSVSKSSKNQCGRLSCFRRSTVQESVCLADLSRVPCNSLTQMLDAVSSHEQF